LPEIERLSFSRRQIPKADKSREKIIRRDYLFPAFPFADRSPPIANR
jgi:hypothetical protein